jgi:hypothetical protein
MTIVNALFSILGAASAAFLAYGCWVCLHHLASDCAQLLPKKNEARKPRSAAHWPRTARVG